MAVDELQQLRAERDRLESLVGTAYHEDGTAIPALLNAMNQPDLEAMRHEIEAVVNFLRASNPHQG